METSTKLTSPDYFFDTTVLIAYFKDEDPYTVRVVEPVLKGERTAVISAVTVAEVVAATEMDRPDIRSKRLAVLAALAVRTVDRAVAERGGALRREYHLELPDALIVASAEQAGGHFLSKDPHFERLVKAGVLDGKVYE